MTKQQYEANARNTYNLLKVTAEALKKAREAKKKKLNYGQTTKTYRNGRSNL